MSAPIQLERENGFVSALVLPGTKSLRAGFFVRPSLPLTAFRGAISIPGQTAVGAPENPQEKTGLLPPDSNVMGG